MTASCRFFRCAFLLALPGCAAWQSAPVLPTRNSLVLEQLVISSDFPLPQHHRLLDELVAQRGALATKLGLPTSDEPIHVYLFGSADKFKQFMNVNYPEFPERRAFFVESDTRLMVYAYWGDRVAEDLRHEVAHGYLHAAVGHLPLWLDEGLAEYFEVGRGNDGLNTAHVNELQVAIPKGWKPDLRRLEALTSAGDMTQLDYAESWAWVHLLLQSGDADRLCLQNYLQSLRRGEARDAFATKLREVHLDYERRLQSHVEQLAYSLR